MTECFEACRDDDSPYEDDGWNSGEKITKREIYSQGVNFPILKSMRSDKWQIKRANPDVLNIDEIANKYKLGDWSGYGNACDQNGQLREWLRPEQVELRDAAKTVLNNHFGWTMDTASSAKLALLQAAFENLKPPCENK